MTGKKVEMTEMELRAHTASLQAQQTAHLKKMAGEVGCIMLDSIATSLKSIARSLKKLAGPEIETPTEMQRIFAGLAEAVTASELCAHGMREPDCDICQGRSRTT